MAFLPAKDFIGELVSVQVDRPMGSRHPRWGFVYPLNYGYVPGVTGLDGEELDAYILGVFEPVERFRGQVLAVLHRIDDADDKLIVAPPGKQYSDEQIIALTEFQERAFQSIIIRSAEAG